MNPSQPHNPADIIRQQLRDVAETWTDDDGETDLVNLDAAIQIVDRVLANQPTVSYQVRMETR